MLSLSEGLKAFYASAAPSRQRRSGGRNAQAVQLSLSNGFVGTEAQKRAMEKRDAELGVPIRYVKTHEKVNYRGETIGAYRAEFVGHHSNKNRWLRAHNRNDMDAGYGDPQPGYTHGKFPSEFSE